MQKKILASLMYTFLFITCVLVITIFEINDWIIGGPIGGLFAGVVLPVLLSSFTDFFDNTNWKTSQRKLKRGNFLKDNDTVRISFAYLFRIKIDGKYFLVQNSRGTKKYQPVGGVYKLHDEEAKYLKENFAAEDDDKIPVDESSKLDYRLLLKNKYLRKFTRRFNRTTSRESLSNLEREFREELFETQILDQSEFGILKYNYCGRHFTDLSFSDHFQCYELLMADIIDVRLTNKQEDLFRNLNKESEKYYFATTSEIKSLGVNDKYLHESISSHTKKILIENASSLSKNKRNYKNYEVEICFN